MITPDKIRHAGSLGKPHGINGEITAFIPSEIDPDALRCIILDIDGIFVPFFIDEWRPKSSESVLLKLDGINNESSAKQLANKELYILSSDMEKMSIPENEKGGFYASDIIGYTVYDGDRHPIGRITDYDDQTENILILVQLPDNREVYLPLANDLIEEFDPEKSEIVLDLPEGIIEDAD